MNAALSVFQAGIKDLKWYIDTVEIEWKLLAIPVSDTPTSFVEEQVRRLQSHVAKGLAKRRFDYNSVIISLYGVLEQYIEAMVRSYASQLNILVPKYSDLPEAIRNSHISQSMTLLVRAGQSRYRGAVTAEGIVANLHSCLSNAHPYRLNTDAFCLHAANFRTEVIDDTFAKVGILGISQRLRLFPPLSEYLVQEHGERDLAKISTEKIYYYLNDLAERRNEVAHGSPSQLLSSELLLEYIKFVESYCFALYEIAHCHLAEHLAKFKGIDLGNPIKVFGNSIVCLEIRNIRIALGDTLVAATGNADRPYFIGQIQELQIDNVPIQFVSAPPTTKIGARVTFKAKETYRYFLVVT